MSEPDAITAITRQRVVPVVRTRTVEEAYAICARVIGAGLNTLELTATIPGWEELLRRCRTDFSDAVIGIGTITDPNAARRAVDTGASFLVSPYPVQPAIEAIADTGVPFISGGFSPGEVAGASAFGLSKLFPAHVGGVSYLKTLLAILPGAKLMPTGGINVGEVGTWLAAGAVAVGVGSDLYGAPDLDEALDDLHSQLDFDSPGDR